MALFQKKPQTGSHSALYTIGQQKTLLIVGLGNIGKEYDGTKHNLGFAIADAAAEALELTEWSNKKSLDSQLISGTVSGARVILIKPSTLMNNSGQAVLKVSQFYKIPLQNIVVIHDELDLKYGQIRTAVGGSSAGHNGVQSVIDTLGQDFSRLRVGIGPKQPTQMDSADYVLADLTKAQQKQLPNLLKEATSIITEYIYSGGQLTADTRNFIV